MEERIRLLISSLYSGRIDVDEFITSYFENNQPDPSHVLEVVNNAMELKNGDLLEEGIVLLLTEVFSISNFIPFLLNLLTEPWHTRHEDILILLQGEKSAFFVDQLFKITELDLVYLKFDDTYQLSRKCVKLLSRINTIQSIKHLVAISGGENSIVAGYAKKELTRK